MSGIARIIEITCTPHGEAPPWVRRGWLGCRLPCEPECGHTPVYVGGVVSRQKTEKMEGYSVSQGAALEILETHDPVAAKWFREHGYPREGEAFRFKLEEAVVVETYTAKEAARLGPLHVFDDMQRGTMREID